MSSTFESLGLSSALLRAVADEGYTTPTPIQAQAIPVILDGRRVVDSQRNRRVGIAVDFEKRASRTGAEPDCDFVERGF